MDIAEIIKAPWPWYVAGPLITATMLVIGYYGYSFGISATMQTICAAAGGKRFSELFNFDWKRDTWNLVFIAGSITGGYLATTFFQNEEPVKIATETATKLKSMGVQLDNQYIPKNIFNWHNLASLQGIVIMVLGGFLVGFGTRYAGGCTSGHAITGLSNLQWPSLVAVIGFFIGGLIMSHWLLPIILGL